MISKETALQHTELFQKALLGIQDAGIGEASLIASDMAIRIDEQEILLLEKNPRMHHFTTPTAFDLGRVALDGPPQYMGTLIIDPSQMRSLGKRAFQADLVRTLAIADQFPDQGFQDTHRLVYQRALGIQEEWLDAKGGNIRIPHDPRIAEEETLLRQVMGDAKYFTDTSYAEFVDAIQTMPGIMDYERPLLEARFGSDTFIVTRGHLNVIAYATVMGFVDRYDLQSADQRSTDFAHYLLSYLLMRS